jgi:hypothetical protein
MKNLIGWITCRFRLICQSDIAQRAGKTFVQAFLAALPSLSVVMAGGVTAKKAVLAALIAALSAALSVVMNGLAAWADTA